MLSAIQRIADASNPVLRIGDKPESANPFVELDGAVFQDRADTNRELFLSLARLARP